jgi:hypothetical protein
LQYRSIFLSASKLLFDYNERLWLLSVDQKRKKGIEEDQVMEPVIKISYPAASSGVLIDSSLSILAPQTAGNSTHRDRIINS